MARQGVPDPGTGPGVDPPGVPPRWSQWVAFAAAPLAWLVHFLLAYAGGEGLCSLGVAPATGRVVLLASSTLFVLIAVAATLFSWRVYRRAARTAPAYDDFLPRVGLLSGLLFAFAIVVEAVPLFVLELC